MERIHVDVAVQPQSYEVMVGTDLFGQIADDLRERPLASRYAVIADSRTGGLFGERLGAELTRAGIRWQLFTFPEGEASKNRHQKELLEDAMLDAGYGRDSAVIALGGGVTGDLAGFVAATYMRGIPVIQVPTSTLAMADSAIGSKTAVDVPQGKNLIGAFHSPEAVYIDVRTLETLDRRNYFAGLVELIKHSFIRRPELADYLEEHRDIIVGRQGADYGRVMEKLWITNSAVKNEVVSADQKESNLRKILNYGHTLGHGVELASGFRLIHGECVAIGIAYAAWLSNKLGYGTREYAEYQIRMLREYGQDCRIPEDLDGETILAAMRRDKKVRNGRIEFILLDGPGHPVTRGDGDYGIPVTEGTILETVKEFRRIF